MSFSCCTIHHTFGANVGNRNVKIPRLYQINLDLGMCLNAGYILGRSAKLYWDKIASQVRSGTDTHLQVRATLPFHAAIGLSRNQPQLMFNYTLVWSQARSCPAEKYVQGLSTGMAASIHYLIHSEEKTVSDTNDSCDSPFVIS